MLYYNFVIFPSYFFYLLTVCHHNIFTRQQIAELNNWTVSAARKSTSVRLPLCTKTKTNKAAHCKKM